MQRSEVLDRREQYYTERLSRHNRRRYECDTATLRVILNLLFTCDVVQNHLNQRFTKYGLSSAAFNILMILRKHGKEGLPLHEIGELLLVSRANITGVMDSLEANSLVRRQADPGDRRVRLGVITEAGDALLDSLLPGHYRSLQKEASGLTGAEKATMTRLLRKLRQSVQKAHS